MLGYRDSDSGTDALQTLFLVAAILVVPRGWLEGENDVGDRRSGSVNEFVVLVILFGIRK